MLWLWDLDRKSVEPLQAGGRWPCFPVGAGESTTSGRVGSIDPDRRTHAGQKAVFHLVLRQRLSRTAAVSRWGADRCRAPRWRRWQRPAWPGTSLAQVRRAPTNFPDVGSDGKRGRRPDVAEGQERRCFRRVQGSDVPHGLVL